MTPDVAASIRAKALRVGQQTGEEFERTLVRFAAERWLYRLGQSPALDFTTIGERLIAFLGPVREAIVGREPLNARWVPAQAWERTDEDTA